MHLSLTSYYQDIKKYWIDSNSESISNTSLYKSNYNWKLKCIFTERPYCLLSDSISNILDIIASKSHNYSLSNLVLPNNPNSTSSLSVAMDTISRTFQDIPDAQELDNVMKKIFQEEEFSVENESKPLIETDIIKSAGYNSILGIFSRYLLKYKNIKAMALLWTEFTKEVRWHWENKVPMLNIDSSNQVNLNLAIIHQKLHLVTHSII